MKQRITAAELKAMTMKELAAWVEFNACAINRTMVMSWGHEELFKEYHIRPEYIGYKACRLIVKAFHFTSRTRKADAQSFAEWLHWAIFGEYPAEETTETAEQVEETETEETEETEAETIEETAEEAKEVVTMKKYFKVTFEYAEDIYCTNLAHAETAEDVEREYSKYPWKSIKEAQPWDVDEAKMKGMPIIEVEAAQQPQEAPHEAPDAEAEQQPTETENAPQAATQTADNDSTTDNPPAIMEAIENAHKSRYSARQTAPLTFAIWDNVKNIPIIETTSNGITAYMDIFGIDHIDADTAEPADTTTAEEEEETMFNTFTPAETAMHAATVRGIIRRKGGYRERDILNRPHTVERGETWNEAHKVVEILATTPDPDGYRPGCAVDIVTRAIVG